MSREPEMRRSKGIVGGELAGMSEEEKEITRKEIEEYLDQRAKRLGINRACPNYKKQSVIFIDTTETIQRGFKGE